MNPKETLSLQNGYLYPTPTTTTTLVLLIMKEKESSSIQWRQHQRNFLALARMKKMEKESEQEFIGLQTGLPTILVTSNLKSRSGSPDQMETVVSTVEHSHIKDSMPKMKSSQ